MSKEVTNGDDKKIGKRKRKQSNEDQFLKWEEDNSENLIPSH